MGLKPCPNCKTVGRSILSHRDTSGANSNIMCPRCGRSTGWYKSEAEAISAWNNRPDLKPLHDLAEKWKYLWYDLSGDSGGYGECAKELRKALKQMEA